MNKTQYLEELSKYLKRVPKQDLEDALEYYTEYFEEAGEENEQRIIEELGSPKELAKKIIIECVDKNFSGEAEVSEEEVKKENKEKKNLSIWLILAAVFALPLSPVIIALLVVALAVIFSIVVTLVSLIASFGVMAIGGIICALVGIYALFISPTGGLLMIGVSLVMAAVGVIFFALLFTLFDLLIKSLSKSGSKLVHEKAGVKK